MSSTSLILPGSREASCAPSSLVLTMGGTDPCGAAGVTVDHQVFRDYHLQGLTAITSVLAQNTMGVSDLFAVPPAMLSAQVQSLNDDGLSRCLQGIKIGLLPSVASVEVVASFLDSVAPLTRDTTVVDPVLSSGVNGVNLVEKGVLEAIVTLLGSRIRLLTPNLPEAKQLFCYGRPGSAIPTCSKELLSALVEIMGCNVLLKGGHCDDHSTYVVDLLGLQTGALIELEKYERVSYHVRGTGCQLAAAVMAEMITGRKPICGEGEGATGDRELVVAVEGGRRYLNTMLRAAVRIGKGTSRVRNATQSVGHECGEEACALRETVVSGRADACLVRD